MKKPYRQALVLTFGFLVAGTLQASAAPILDKLISANLTALLQPHAGQTLRNLDITQVPEPATLTMLGIGLIGIVYRARRTT